jgi:hypothetical protein
VFGLEGMGLWFTSLFVDVFVKWIRSRNWKSFGMVVLFAIVVAVYITILVNLNVTLEMANGDKSEVYSRVVTLLCFLPLLTGVGNGYYKLTIEGKEDTFLKAEQERELKERIRQDRREDKIKSKMIENGMNPLSRAFQSTTPAVEQLKTGDWRLLSDEDKYEVLHVLSVKQIMDKHNVARATAYEWKKK